MENSFSTLKTELVYRRSWRTREEAENARSPISTVAAKPSTSGRSSAGDPRTSSKPATITSFQPKAGNPPSDNAGNLIRGFRRFLGS